jgi:hypothetical protein
MGGYLHLLQAPLGAAAAIEHARTYRFGLASRRVRRSCNIGRCIRDRGKEDDENQRDASTTHRALNGLISISIN